MTKPNHVWMVRTGNGNELADIVQEEQVVAIGWMEMGDVSDLDSREEFWQRYRQAFPGHSPGRLSGLESTSDGGRVHLVHLRVGGDLRRML
jgi:predicted Mrr-cat superfamily restriction endonuclease